MKALCLFCLMALCTAGALSSRKFGQKSVKIRLQPNEKWSEKSWAQENVRNKRDSPWDTPAGDPEGAFYVTDDHQSADIQNKGEIGHGNVQNFFFNLGGVIVLAILGCMLVALVAGLYIFAVTRPAPDTESGELASANSFSSQEIEAGNQGESDQANLNAKKSHVAKIPAFKKQASRPGSAEEFLGDQPGSVSLSVSLTLSEEET